MKYVLKQIQKDKTLWTSDVLETTGNYRDDQRQVVQAVIAGYIMGEPRWAETPTGAFLYGMDGKGRGMDPETDAKGRVTQDALESLTTTGRTR